MRKRRLLRWDGRHLPGADWLDAGRSPASRPRPHGAAQVGLVPAELRYRAPNLVS